MHKAHLDKINTIPEPWDPYWATWPEEQLSPQVMDVEQNIFRLRQELDETRRKRLVQFGENKAQDTLTQEGELGLFEILPSNGHQLTAADKESKG